MNMHLFKNIKSETDNKEKGFTFIETLIAVTILIIVVAGVLTMTTVSIKTNFNQINHTKAVKLAEEGVEKKLREDFDSLMGESTAYGNIANFPTYRRTITVNNIDVDNKTITVNVTWRVRERSGLSPITLSVIRTR